MSNKDIAKEYMPAFPVTFPNDDGKLMTMVGMSLRDWFAGMALMGMAGDCSLHDTWEIYALKAYMFADAMLKEREK